MSRYTTEQEMEQAAGALEAMLSGFGGTPKNFVRENGVCCNFLDDLPYAITSKMFKEWKHFSGNSEYPVPSGDESTAPEHVYHSGENLYDKRTTYGKLRWDLIKHCAKYLRNYVNKKKRKLGE